MSLLQSQSSQLAGFSGIVLYDNTQRVIVILRNHHLQTVFT